MYFRVRRDELRQAFGAQAGGYAGRRVEVGEEKEDPLDFAMWKAAKPGEPYWDSPWARAARAGISVFGVNLRHWEQIDIHGAGMI